MDGENMVKLCEAKDREFIRQKFELG